MPSRAWQVGDKIRISPRGWRGVILERKQPGGPKTRWLFKIKWTRVPDGMTARTAAIRYSARGDGWWRADEIMPAVRTPDEMAKDQARYGRKHEKRSPHGWTEIDSSGQVVTFPPGTPYPVGVGEDPFKILATEVDTH